MKPIEKLFNQLWDTPKDKLTWHSILKKYEIKDKVVDSLVDKFIQRSENGIAKYGTTLHENNTDDFLNHLQEELMDACLYIEKLKQCENHNSNPK